MSKLVIYAAPADIAANYDANGTPTDDPPQIPPYLARMAVTLAKPVTFIQLDAQFDGKDETQE